jgi:CheY-like chemotaxis protein
MEEQAGIRAEVTCRCGAVHEEPLEKVETILLVEDETFVREVTCEVLRAAGYRVLTAKNAVEGAREYDQACGEVDLLLTDVILPGETGRVLAARLRLENPRLKVLLVTGYVEQMRASEARYEECLAKPFSSGVLLRRVRQVIDCGGLRLREVKEDGSGAPAGARSLQDLGGNLGERDHAGESA